MHMDENARIKSANKVQKLLDRAAYISLFFDIAIAIITLASLNIFKWNNLQSVLLIVNYGLTAVVVVSLALFIILFLLTRSYNKIINTIVRIPSVSKNKLKSLHANRAMQKSA